jgi:SAM-dependent methyltransferase
MARARKAAGGIPDRISRTVDGLGLMPDDRILEIGCGPGVAAAMVCARLGGGHLTAIDRSATAVERTRGRIGHHERTGRATVVQADLVELGELPDLAPGGPPYDLVFAVNVNLFWTGPATAELAVLRAGMRPGAVLHLCYDFPTQAAAAKAEAGVTAALTDGGFDVRTRTSTPVLHVMGRYAAAA